MVKQIISHYHLLKKLGEGGMDEIYLAEDTQRDKFQAIAGVKGYFRNE